MPKIQSSVFTFVVVLSAAMPGWTAGSHAVAQQILSRLHHANQTEIAMARMAKQKGSSDKIRAYGDRLIRSHRAADEKIQAVAEKHGIALVSPPTSGFLNRMVVAREKRTLTSLQQSTGEDFDKTFTDAMIDDHMRDINNLESAANALPPGDVQDLLTQLLPSLEQHLKQAQEIQSSS